MLSARVQRVVKNTTAQAERGDPRITFVGSGPITWVNDRGEPLYFYNPDLALEQAAAFRAQHKLLQAEVRGQQRAARKGAAARRETGNEEVIREVLLDVQKEGISPRVAVRVAVVRLAKQKLEVSPSYVRKIRARMVP